MAIKYIGEVKPDISFMYTNKLYFTVEPKLLTNTKSKSRSDFSKHPHQLYNQNKRCQSTCIEFKMFLKQTPTQTTVPGGPSEMLKFRNTEKPKIVL